MYHDFSVLWKNPYCILISLKKKQVKNWAENFKFRLSTDDINELSLTPNGVQPTEPLSYQNPLFLIRQKTFLSEMGFFTDCWKKLPIKWQQHLFQKKNSLVRFGALKTSDSCKWHLWPVIKISKIAISKVLFLP